ncbi:MAG: NAD(P)H-hydrate dehydratase [Angustibacter sp.]
MTDAPQVITPAFLRSWPLPDPGSSKESRGRTLVVGGHVETPGAVLLAAEAALRCGAGKLQVATVADAAMPLAVRVPEGLVRGLPQTPDGDVSPDAADQLLELADGCAAVLLGPGMGDVEVVAELLARVVPHLEATVVLDAAALAYASSSDTDLSHLGGRCVLTPNPHELALALDVPQDDVEADAVAQAHELARRTGVVVSCGGAQTTIAHPDGRTWVDGSGGVGLAVSGSGDVHAGVVVGLAARGALPGQAAAWAAHLHGRAGDRLAASVGPLGYLAREVSTEIPRVLAEIDV